MQNASGVGFGNVVYVEIKVGSGSSASVTPGPSPTPGGPTATSSGLYSVSGNAGTGSADIHCDGAGGKPSIYTTSNDSGAFTCMVPWNWDGEIIPTRGNWIFDPTSLPVDNVQGNVSGYNFTAHQ
jgi:hypothetical protein